MEMQESLTTITMPRQGGFARAGVGQLDQPTLPKAMEPKALEIVEAVVPARDAGEELVHAFGPVLPRLIVAFGHALRRSPPPCVGGYLFVKPTRLR